MSMSPPEMTPDGMQPSPKPGTSTGTKVLIILAIVFGVLLLLCCGGVIGFVFWAQSYMTESFSEDPAKVATVTQEIAQLDIPEGLDPTASVDMTLQARYKIGRCLARLQRTDEALGCYMKIVYGYLDEASRDVRNPAAAELWFTRAAFDAVEILAAAGRWKEAVRVLMRVVEAGVPAAAEAKARADRIRLKHWIMFY